MSAQEQFEQAQAKLKTLSSQTNDVMLQLYSLFKQATKGDASGKKPGMLDIVGKAKWEAWEKHTGKTQDQAMEEYAKLVGELASKESAA